MMFHNVLAACQKYRVSHRYVHMFDKSSTIGIKESIINLDCTRLFVMYRLSDQKVSGPKVKILRGYYC